MTILKALPSGDKTLITIMRLSKAHWGYSNKQLLKWQDELTVSRTEIINHHVYKLLTKNTTVGFYSFKKKLMTP